jgi:hypothetical protein
VISASPIPQGAIWAIGRISIFGTNGASAPPRPRGGTFSFRFDFLRVWDTEEGGDIYTRAYGLLGLMLVTASACWDCCW